MSPLERRQGQIDLPIPGAMKMCTEVRRLSPLDEHLHRIEIVDHYGMERILAGERSDDAGGPVAHAVDVR